MVFMGCGLHVQSKKGRHYEDQVTPSPVCTALLFTTVRMENVWGRARCGSINLYVTWEVEG
jgi:hypothetical protein